MTDEDQLPLVFSVNSKRIDIYIYKCCSYDPQNHPDFKDILDWFE